MKYKNDIDHLIQSYDLYNNYWKIKCNNLEDRTTKAESKNLSLHTKTVIHNNSVIMEDTIKKVIFSGPKTIILWKDGTKTITTCGEGDHYDKYVGFCTAVTKKMFGSTSKVKKILDKYVKEDK